MDTVALFQHRTLGGALLITSCARYESTPGHKVGRYGYTIVSFDSGGMGQFAYEAFKAGIAQRTDKRISLYDEEEGQYVVGDIGQLGIAPAAA